MDPDKDGTTSTEATDTTTEQDDALAEAQLLQGFDGIEEPTEKPAPKAEEPAQAVEAPAAAPAAAAPQYVQLTKDVYDELMALKTSVPGLKDTMDRQFGTAFGKMGGYDRWKAEQDAQVAVANELRGKITDAQIEALKGQDLGEVANALDILRKIPVVPVPSAAAVDPKQFEDVVQQRVGALVEKLPDIIGKHIQLDRLTQAHPDWETVKDEPGFKEFREKLPQADKDQLASASWNAAHTIKVIGDYKKSKAKPTAAPSPSVEDLSQRRASRLAQGGTPRGSGQATGSDPLADFVSGYTTGKVGT